MVSQGICKLSGGWLFMLILGCLQDVFWVAGVNSVYLWGVSTTKCIRCFNDVSSEPQEPPMVSYGYLCVSFRSSQVPQPTCYWQLGNLTTLEGAWMLSYQEVSGASRGKFKGSLCGVSWCVLVSEGCPLDFSIKGVWKVLPDDIQSPKLLKETQNEWMRIKMVTQHESK